MAASTVRDQSVFLNCPYDGSFEPKILTLITALIAVGRTPRAAAEITATSTRLRKIIEIMDQCSVSIHVISPPSGEARYNMAFELGLAYRLTLKKKPKHRLLILESQPYRLQKTLSDLNGHDPIIYSGTQIGIIQAILDFYPAGTNNPTAVEVDSLLKKVKVKVKKLKENEGRDTILTPSLWVRTVMMVTEMAEDAGILK